MPTSKDSLKNKLLLILIIASGAFYRFFNLNWDEGHWYHPDERNIAVAVGKLSLFDQLNPGFFAYNGFWIYLTKLVAEVTALITGNLSWLSGWNHLNLITRGLSAFFSTLSLFLVFKVAQKVINTKAALLAAALSAYTVGYLQYAHYGVTESILVFWVLLLTLLSLHRRWYLAALVSGLALATKTSAATFLIIPGLSYLLFEGKKTFRQPLVGLVILVITTFALTPYSFLSWSQFTKSMNYESGVVTGRLPVPYTLQFNGTTAYIFSVINLPWHLGPLLTIIALVAVVAWLIYQLVNRKTNPFLPALIFAVVYFAYVGSWHTKFIRYLLPIYPILIISATWLLFRIKQRFHRLGLALMIITIASGFLWSYAYMAVFQTQSTRLTASHWIYQNLPADSIILTEHWDDRVPTRLEGANDNFKYLELKNYDPDNINKIKTLSESLAAGDYLILSSRRLSGSIGKATIKYPFTSAYYQLLAAEKLGYVLIKRFSSYPRLGPITISDESAEETFQVYDHPTVYIYQNTGRLPAATLYQQLYPPSLPTPGVD